MKLSTLISRAGFLRAAALAAAALLAACGDVGMTRPGADDGVAVDVNAPVRVALLAPIGAADPTLQRIGRDLVNAARLAQQDLRNADIDLQVYDDRGTLEGGRAAAQLAVNGGARIIVGPLLSTAAAGADPVAQAAGINVLTFSNNPEVASRGVYLLGISPGSAAGALAGYARSRGLDRFGVLYVQGETNEVIRDSVIGAISRAGGRVVSTQAYPFSRQGIDDGVAVMSVSLQNAGANAVMLTDRSTAGLVADGLRANGLTADRALFLGLQPWGGDASTLALPNLQGAVYAAPDPGLLAGFEGRYRNVYGSAPHELAVLAYDGIGAVGALIAEARARGGSPFSTARITQPQGFAGASGAFRFFPDGTSQRNLAIVEVRGGSSAVIVRAPRGFDAVGN